MPWLNSMRTENRASDPPSRSSLSVVPRYAGPPAELGKDVNSQSAMTVAAVFGCTRVLSTAIAGLAFDLFERQKKTGGRAKALRHSLYPILHDSPNEYMTSFQWVVSNVLNVCLTGDAYSQIVRDDLERVTGLYPLNPARVKVYVAPDGSIWYEFRKQDGNSRWFKKEEINHWMFQTFDGLCGVNPVEYGRRQIGKMLARDEFEGNLIVNGGTPSGVLKFKQTLDEDAYKKVRESWEKMHRGATNAGRIAILDDDADFKQITQSNHDMQWVEQGKEDPLEICAFYGVPPSYIGLDVPLTEQQQITFRQHTVLPMCQAFEQCVERDLLLFSDKKNYFMEFNLDTLERATIENRYNAYMRGIQWGITTRNECRQKENLEPLDPDIGDIILSPLNMVPAQYALELAMAQIKSKMAKGFDPQDPAQAEPPADDPAQQRAKNAAKRAISGVFARISTKESRKLEQIAKNAPDLADAAKRMRSFYAEQRATFIEMLEQALWIAAEFAGEVTPSVEVRCAEIAGKIVDAMIDKTGIQRDAATDSVAIAREMPEQVIDEAISSLIGEETK
jgi:HK97 family phage portal protein